MGRTPEPSRREPCPDRILDDIGFGFGAGAVGGSAFLFLKGVYESPRGEHLLVGGSQAVRMNSPRLGGSFATSGDYSLCFPEKENNEIRLWYMLPLVARGALLLATLEGAGIMLKKMVSSVQNMPNSPGDSSSFSSSWFGGFFGTGDKKKETSSSGSTSSGYSTHHL